MLVIRIYFYFLPLLYFPLTLTAFIVCLIIIHSLSYNGESHQMNLRMNFAPRDSKLQTDKQ